MRTVGGAANEVAGDRRLRAYGAAVLALTVLWLIVGLYAVHGSLRRTTPFQLPFERTLRPALVLPQGWGFFTRPPDAPYQRAVVREGNTWAPGPQTHATLDDFWGFRRSQRVRAFELEGLKQLLRPDQLTPCEGSPTRCLDRATSIPMEHPLAGAGRDLVLCGAVGVIEQPPLRWVWWQQLDADHTWPPSLVARLDVQC